MAYKELSDIYNSVFLLHIAEIENKARQLVLNNTHLVKCSIYIAKIGHSGSYVALYNITEINLISGALIGVVKDVTSGGVVKSHGQRAFKYNELDIVSLMEVLDILESKLQQI